MAVNLSGAKYDFTYPSVHANAADLAVPNESGHVATTLDGEVSKALIIIARRP